MSINAINIINILMKSYNYSSSNVSTPINGKEIELSNNIINLIGRCKEAFYTEIEVQDELVFDDAIDEPSLPNDEQNFKEASTSTSHFVKEQPSSLLEEGLGEKDYNVSSDYKREVVNFWKSGKKRPLNFETVQKRYRRVRNRRQLYRWEEQVQKGGSRSNKLKEIAQRTLNKFIEARNRKMIVHDIHIKRWALHANQTINLQLEGFQASTYWLWNFKNKYNVVSRKTTKFVTRHYQNNVQEISTMADNFVTNTKRYFERTINSDTYCAQLDRLKTAIDEKRPELANRKGIVFQHDNARPHVSIQIRQKLLQLG
ncbi:uncharacterized protein LOC128885597 [Hylaeus anthracinus]|uniref:uncharacterized protein LOC128885597 n=1 Tax=Hylaeus anthracinus TaxID=313031 RepID=UPI0023B8FDC8|nr:uncharacterized protein LOC128885597 [Hylaeus anthracinus]